MKLLLVVCLRLINIDTQQLSSCGVELYICAAYSELDKVGDVKKTVTITDLQEQFSFPSGLTYRGGGWQSQKRRNTPKFLGLGRVDLVPYIGENCQMDKRLQ
nr:hypothetical protein CFP56_75214 [Quercus suber]